MLLPLFVALRALLCPSVAVVVFDALDELVV